MSMFSVKTLNGVTSVRALLPSAYHNDDDGDQYDNEFGRVEPSGLAFRDHFENTF